MADQMIYSTIRTDQDTQRLSIPTRIGVRHPKLSQVIQMMEGNIEDPMSPADLAEEVGMSTRQLERLFRRYLNRSPKRYYMELRLQKARNLLMQTDMSVINVALACGFASPSHFSKNATAATTAPRPTVSVGRKGCRGQWRSGCPFKGASLSPECRWRQGSPIQTVRPSATPFAPKSAKPFFAQNRIARSFARFAPTWIPFTLRSATRPCHSLNSFVPSPAP